MSLRRNARRAALAVAVAALAGAAAPAVSQAQFDPADCTPTIGYDPAIPTWDQFFAAHPDQDAVLPLGWGNTGSGGGAPQFGSGFAQRPPRPQPDAGDLRVLGRARRRHGGPTRACDVIKKYLGKSASGLRDIQFYVVGTTENLASLDTPDGDAAFWRGVRVGRDPRGARARGRRHRGRRSPGSRRPRTAASPPRASRSRAHAYELLARTDCENIRRLQSSWTSS